MEWNRVIKNVKLRKWGDLKIVLMPLLLLSSLLWPVVTQAAPPSSPDDPLVIQNDALLPKDADQMALSVQISTQSAAPSGAGMGAPGYYQTSEYMIGHVAVGLILPESDGSHEDESEDWSEAEIAQVQAEVQDALAWWASLEPAAHLSFTIEMHAQVPIGYEPIGHGLDEEGEWVGETMTALGFENDSAFGAVRDYVNDLRDRVGSDWAFAILVVDSSADSDGRFADNYFAYAYIGGPFTVMTYDNSGYGISNMDAVVAHEIGHIFHALDQYASAGARCNYRAGYLNVQNANSLAGGDCLSDEPSIMRGGIAPYTNRAIDDFARGQIGWQDINFNGVLDAVDASPQLSVDLEGEDDDRFSFSGYAWQTPVPSPELADVTISRIAAVGVLVDGTTWVTATSQSGHFDAISVTFQLDIGPLDSGLHLLEIQAVNSEAQVLTSVANVLVFDPVDGALDSALISRPTIVPGNELNQFKGIAIAAYGDEITPDAPTVAEVQFSVDGGEWQVAVAHDGQFDSSQEDFDILLTDLADGPHSLTVRTVDSNGQVETNVETHHFQVETTFTLYLPVVQR
jgi:hypothetical protein